ncbi:serine threonine protein kinase CMGC group [Coemansia spiralis]|uniref:Serine threonine protein kinase CMGC group n=1 Tax=Coemansia spiralis TaxID=417178 RepID=A0A9W8GCL5_9FUNG|nr:serine threonine protein kinase CMGC group [Coemansia spiralis]
MSVLSFVTSLFRPRNNHAESQNDAHTSKTSLRSSDGSSTLNNKITGTNRDLASKHTFKPTSKNNSGKLSTTNISKLLDIPLHPPPTQTTTYYDDQRNEIRNIFPSTKNQRPLQPKPRGPPVYNGVNNYKYLRHAQQKAEAPCDDRDGHYIVVPGREFTQRFKIRRLLGQGTFGKVMECDDLVTGRLVAIKVIRAVPKYRDAAKIEIRVLQTLERNDPTNAYQCMHLNETFDHRNHVCMVFDLLGPSVFDFLKENEFRPFSLHQVQLFAEQLLRSVAFLHSLNLVHTDLKPENILLENGEFDVVPFGNSQVVKTRMLKSTKIRLIDFGSATFNNEYHSQVVSTRHYRAPEIILNLGWSFPCDMWSIGCIILELLTGEALFQTHDNNEHLAMMEIVVGKAPSHIVRSVPQDLRPKFFRSDGTARYPAPENSRQSQKGLRSMRPLSQLVNPSTNPIYANLHDLLYRLLQYDPRARISAKEACEHPFFRYRVGPDGRLVNRPPSSATHHQQQPQPVQQQPLSYATTTGSHADLAPSSSISQRSHRPSFQTTLSSNAIAQNPPAVAAASASSSHAYANGSNTNSNNVQQQGYYYRDQPYQHQHQQVPSVTEHHARHTPSYYRYDNNFQQQQPQPQSQNVRPYAADGYQWQYSSSSHAPPLSASSAASTGHASNNTGNSQPLAVQPSAEQQRAMYATAAAAPSLQVRVSEGKRKAGIPIDSGYFPDMPLSASDYNNSGSYFSSGSSYPSPNAGGGALSSTSSLSSNRQQNQVIPRNHFSSGPSFTGVPPNTMGASNNNAPPTGKGCNLPPLASHISSQQNHYSMPSYHQQRHQMNGNPAALSANITGGVIGAQQAMAGGNLVSRLFPVDSNTTPTLTSATTATPTPGSTSAQLSGSHSLDNSVPIAPPSSLPSSSVAASAAIIGGGYLGAQKAVGRQLPSLMFPNNTNSTSPNVNTLSNGLARTSIAEHMQQHRYPPTSSGSVMPQQKMYQHLSSGSPMLLQQRQTPSSRGGFYPHLPSAQSLLHQIPPLSSPTALAPAPTIQHQSPSGQNIPLDHYHYHFAAAAPPSSANNSAGGY